MELNSYQREVMGNLSAYLSALNETDDLHKAWQKYWNDQDVTVGLPSDPILVQTTTNLMNPDHPYTRRLNADFNGRVGVFTKEMLLNGQNFTPDTVHEQLTVCILSYGSLRIDSKKKDVRKVYQENGNLKNFADYFKDESELLADTPDTTRATTQVQTSAWKC